MSYFEDVIRVVSDLVSRGFNTKKIRIVDDVPRRTGSTAWILNAAMQNPCCYILFDTSDNARRFELEFMKAHGDRTSRHCSYPMFMSVGHFTEAALGISGLPEMPVIYDQSVIRTMIKQWSNQPDPEIKTHIVNPFGAQKMFVAGLRKGVVETCVETSGSVVSDESANYFDGKALDNIKLYTDLVTEEECDELIRFLSIVKYCLPTRKRKERNG